MLIKRFGLLLFILAFVVSCNDKNKVETEIDQIPLDISIIRFDKIFGTATYQNLAKMKSDYPIFFPPQYSDSLWLSKSKDTLQKELEFEVEKAFPTNDKLEKALVPLFQHIKYYIPQFKVPKVYTSTSDVDYENKVIVADSIMVIALDNYLGADHKFYEGIPLFISKEMSEHQIKVDVATQYARRYLTLPRDKSLLSQIIYFGKQLYLKDLWLPTITDASKIGYSDSEYSWAKENEEQMWRYFVEKELLYSTDPKLVERFIAPAPFSKFYLEIDNESPGRVGQFLGWQIVKSYMENNEVSANELMTAPSDEIFKKSKYKPKK